MHDYFDFLSLNAKNSEGLWTSPYLDAWGLGLMVTHAIPCISKADGKWVLLVVVVYCSQGTIAYEKIYFKSAVWLHGVVLPSRTIGVAGIDATLDEIENFLSRHQWGSVYSFLMNKHGETIFHPRLKPSTNVSTWRYLTVQSLLYRKFSDIRDQYRGLEGWNTPWWVNVSFFCQEQAIRVRSSLLDWTRNLVWHAHCLGQAL